MKSNIYFDGESGVYYVSENDEIIELIQVDSYGIYNKKTHKFTSIKRYNLNIKDRSVYRVAVFKHENLIRIGDL